MRIVIFGSSGMVGRGALLEALDDPRGDAVLALVRQATGTTHPKLEEVVHRNFFAYRGLESRLAACHGCLFCLGVSSVGMSESDYANLTYDLTLAAATALLAANPGMTFCYVSGANTDSTEQGRRMWARVKGRTENALLRLGFARAYMFRPGYIQPERGIRSKTRLYQAIYDVMGFAYPVLRRLAPGFATTTSILGRAMVEAVIGGAPKAILEVPDINALGGNGREGTG